MDKSIDAGALRERLRVLELRHDAEANAWRWETAWNTRASAALSEKRNLFSGVGVGARDVAFTLRRRDELTPHNAILWYGRGGWEHCFITAISPIDRLYDAVRCARVEILDCLAEANHAPTGARFPGVLTEKYVSHDSPDLHDINTTCHVLVTPKQIEMKRGSIVEVGGEPYHVMLGHYLDGFKNEYEIVREVDL